MRAAVEEVYVSHELETYIVAVVRATRQDSRVAVGSSPRGSLALLKLARAQAALEGRDYVLPDDIKRFLGPALTHRLIMTPDLWMQRRAADEVITAIGRSVAVPGAQ
jgi:MoxR-like ATPase